MGKKLLAEAIPKEEEAKKGEAVDVLFFYSFLLAQITIYC